MANGITDILRRMALYASEYGYLADGVIGNVAVVITVRAYQSLACATAANTASDDGICQSAVVNYYTNYLYFTDG